MIGVIPMAGENSLADPTCSLVIHCHVTTVISPLSCHHCHHCRTVTTATTFMSPLSPLSPL
jgi:hypothetical protein